MEYQKRTITIPLDNHTTQAIEAQEAVGTGLVYHKSIGCNSTTYTIASLSCGNYSIGRTVDTERHAQILLEGLSKMTDWTADQETIVASLMKKFGDKRGVLTAQLGVFQWSVQKYQAELSHQEAIA